MRVVVFDLVPSYILRHVDFSDEVDVKVVRQARRDPVATIRALGGEPDLVFVAQPPGATIGYAVAAALRDAFPDLTIVGVRTADAHRDGFESVGADKVVDPAGIDGEITKALKAKAKAAKAEAAPTSEAASASPATDEAADAGAAAGDG